MPRLTEAEADDLAVKALMAMAVDEYRASLRTEIQALPDVVGGRWFDVLALLGSSDD